MEILTNENVKVGDIFSERWGYNCTQHTYWVVTSVTPKSVVIYPIKRRAVTGQYNGSGTEAPIFSAYGTLKSKWGNVMPNGEGKRCRLGKCFLKVSSYSMARPWNGEPEYFDDMD